MAWGTRQQRLRDILGASNSLCFQVFVVVTEGVVSDKLFDELVAEHDIDFTYDDLATLPKQHIGRLSFNRGFLCQSEKFGRAAQISQIWMQIFVLGRPIFNVFVINTFLKLKCSCLN